MTMTWKAGDPAPIRPRRSECSDNAAYTSALELYIEQIECMLVWMLSDYAMLPERMRSVLEHLQKETCASD